MTRRMIWTSSVSDFKPTMSFCRLSLVGALALSSTFLGVERDWADSVIKNIPVGIHPVDVAFNPTNNDMYVSNQASNTVSVIDSSTNTVVTTIPVGSGPEQ
jgi:YVTN family beta-propeller protein